MGEMAEISAKRKALQAVEALPDEATLDDVIEKLIFLRKIERGLQQREAGEGLSQEEVEKRLGVSWRT
jgi:predicted transcriptional regulator